jgi:hypothetical protein
VVRRVGGKRGRGENVVARDKQIAVILANISHLAAIGLLSRLIIRDHSKSCQIYQLRRRGRSSEAALDPSRHHELSAIHQESPPLYHRDVMDKELMSLKRDQPMPPSASIPPSKLTRRHSCDKQESDLKIYLCRRRG